METHDILRFVLCVGAAAGGMLLMFRSDDRPWLRRVSAAGAVGLILFSGKLVAGLRLLLEALLTAVSALFGCVALISVLFLLPLLAVRFFLR